MPGDVTVNRQVLAEPDAGIAERSWAMLADGTPLVSGEAVFGEFRYSFIAKVRRGLITLSLWM